ncbi:hypothetical protein [Chryseobacterium phocaeense]|uniref:hypothetical protein n=1 Tax=Chryseobacterium phocaeense TaxID=1816690 RepID=UPI0009BA6CC7|nr:hypothetical protein [Chryseobacterium phocaeense]
MSLLSNILWAFQRKEYADITDFNTAIESYQQRILKERASWNPEEIVIQASEADICYEAWIKGKEDIAGNETLIGDEDEVFHEDNSDYGMFQVDLCATLKAQNGSHFTALDLMFQLQNQLSNKELGDHVFFEGLTPKDTEEYKTDIPLYFMYCGS